MTTTCDVCRGKGTLVSDPCGDCRGEGRVNEKASLKIRVPRGVQTGAQARLAGEGEAGPPSGVRGDLLVFFNVIEHDRYERDDFDLHCEEEISIAQAALGDELTVETPWGPYEFKISAGTQPGQRFRISNHGVPREDYESAPRGNLYVHAKIAIPKKLTDRQKELLREFAREDGHTPVEQEGFLGKIKETLKGGRRD
jgi:molecular chaperone DnaJ